MNDNDRITYLFFYDKNVLYYIIKLGDMMSIKEKILLIIIALIIMIPIIISEIKEYNLRQLKKETLKISEILKNEYSEITEITINKEIKGIKTRGEGKAFVGGA